MLITYLKIEYNKIKIKQNKIKSTVKSILTYGAETWSIK
jgi:hypothetical protein